MKYECEFDPDVVLDEDEVYNHAAIHLDYDDIAERIGIEVTRIEIVKELARLESPLFYTLYDAAIAECVEDFYHKIDDEDDEDED
jgi:hypothetical protein